MSDVHTYGRPGVALFGVRQLAANAQPGLRAVALVLPLRQPRRRYGMSLEPRLSSVEYHEDGNVRCQRCEGDGSYSELALCTTFGPDCACNGSRVTVDPCPDCGGSGNA